MPFKIEKMIAENCGTAVSVPAGSKIDMSIGSLEAINTKVIFEERDPELSFRHLISAVGLPADTNIRELAFLMRELSEKKGVEHVSGREKGVLEKYISIADKSAGLAGKLLELAMRPEVKALVERLLS